jgi:molecular chaperone DnaK (HSP70)
MDELFVAVIEKVVGLVRRQLDTLAAGGGGRACDYLFLVGGFAESKLLQRRLEEAFGGEVRKIVVPPNPGSAVVRGAGAYGLAPSRIGVRRSRLTYGVRHAPAFRDGIDPEPRRGRGRYAGRCLGRFKAFVHKGQEVPFNRAVTFDGSPIFPNQPRVTVKVFASPQERVDYDDEPGVRFLGDVVVQLKPGDTKVEVTMYFGGTELAVEARNVASGESRMAAFQWQSADPVPAAAPGEAEG